LSDIIVLPRYEEFLSSHLKRSETEQIFLKIKQFTVCSKTIAQKTPTHFIWNESGYIFPAIIKKLKIFALTYLWSENAKIFPEK